VALETSANRTLRDTRPPRIRSAVTNGRRLFVDGDGNSPWSRRYRDLILGHINDLGGPDVLSQSQISLVKRASAIECELEQQEGRLSRGEVVDLDRFTRAASHLRRMLETLGLERRARDVTPTLREYLRDLRPEAEERPVEEENDETLTAGPNDDDDRVSRPPRGSAR